MKKYILYTIFTIILGLGFTSCTQPTINSKKDLPIEVVSLKELAKYDTILTIPTKDKTYYWDYKTKKYLGASDIENNDSWAIALFVFALIIGCLIGSAFNN